jgi:hypothetical protein
MCKVCMDADINICFVPCGTASFARLAPPLTLMPLSCVCVCPQATWPCVRTAPIC